MKNIDQSLDDIEDEINDGDYEKGKKYIEDTIKECKKGDSLGKQLDRCEELLKTYKAEKKKMKGEKWPKEVGYDWGDNGDLTEFCDIEQHYTKN